MSATATERTPTKRERRTRGARPRRRFLPLLARHGLLLCGAAIALYPTIFVIVTALKTQTQYLRDALGIAWPPSVESFDKALAGGDFFVWFRNSVVLTVLSVALCTLVAAPAAYAIARMRFRGRQLLLGTNVALMIVPPVVMLIPLFLLFSQLNLVDTYLGVTLIYAGLTAPFSLYLLVTFFRTVANELFESAAIDGARHLRILFSIVLPLAGPALATLVVVNSLYVWNELLIALVFLPSDDMQPLMVGLTGFRSRYAIDVPTTMAGMALASLPMVLLYLFSQRFFIRGLTAGAVK